MNFKNGLILILVFVALVAGIAGTRGMKSSRPPVSIIKDMKWHKKVLPQSLTVLPSGEVPGRIENTVVFDGPQFPYEIITGFIKGTTNYIEVIPIQVDMKLLVRGKERYEIFCSSCHGISGDGLTVGRKIGAMAVVASLHDLRIIKMTDGEIFNVITHGRNLMGAHGTMIPILDRWSIIAYVRALQISRYGTLDDLTEAEKFMFKKQNNLINGRE